MTHRPQRLEQIADDEVARLLAALPAELAAAARKLPVLFAARPAPAAGQEEDLLGLLVGAELACEGEDPLPSQMFLFLENLWEEANENERVFREEVRITYLHELGHYLGLDEEDLSLRGLE
jgi:predicted Zn-dependent protease with MMP-like domain